MHEGSIAKGILDTAVAALPRPDAKITKITVIVGVMSGVERECLDLYFAEMSKDTVAQGAALELRRQPAKLVCTSCGQEEPYDNTGELAVHCAKCGQNNKLEGGNELYIESMEIDEK